MALAKLGEVWSGGFVGGGGVSGGTPPECGVLAIRGCYGLRDLAQRKWGVERVLTVRGIGRRRDVAMPATSSRGGALRGLVTRPMQGLEQR